MSHHGNNQPPEGEGNAQNKAMNEAMRKIFGEYPDGKLGPDDEGGIAMSVSHKDGRVILLFPKPVAWVGFTADEAIGLAELLVEHARQAGSKKPLVMKLG